MIYADYAATTPLAEEALEAMLPFLRQTFGNPSGVHTFSRSAREGVDEAREAVAERLDCLPSEVIFTSGATEANNLALRGLASSHRSRGRHIVTSAVEHHAVLRPLELLESEGYEVTRVLPDATGLIRVEDILSQLRADTVLVSVMLANNEVGTIQPISQLSALLGERGVLLHTDAAQAVGKVPLSFGCLGADAMSLSGHKFYGPKGVGALVLRGGLQISSQVVGGGQERGVRSGTENVSGIVGLAKALEVCTDELEQVAARLEQLRNRILGGLDGLEGVMVTGHPEARLPGLLSLAIEGIDGESLVISLDRLGVAASTGSACSSASLSPSHVLKAMGIPQSHISGSLRISLGRASTQGEADAIVTAVRCSLASLRERSLV